MPQSPKVDSPDFLVFLVRMQECTCSRAMPCARATSNTTGAIPQQCFFVAACGNTRSTCFGFLQNLMKALSLTPDRYEFCHVTRKTVTVSTVIPDATECHARSCSLHYDHIEAAALAEVLLAPRRIVLMEAIPVISCVKTCNINSKCVSKQG